MCKFHGGSQLYMLVSLWKSALHVGFTVEVSFTCWFHCGSQLYMLVSLWKSALHVGFTVGVSFTC